MPILEAPVGCDLDESHVATVYCPACEESFCDSCDVLIHQRKKNKGHTREAIEIQEPEPEPVPCDSDASHVAVMYCEDCEENFCSECDYTFHSRKKTAGHARFEGARRPEDVEALKREAEAEALAQKLAQQKLQQQQQAKTAAAGASYANAAAASSKAASNTATVSASPAKPAAAAAAATGAQPATSVAAATSYASEAPLAVEEDLDSDKSGAERAQEYKSAWDQRRKRLIKEKYGVGHWLGLTTDERKDLSVLLCRELLFNPEPSTVKGNRLTVEWSVQSFWTTYQVAVQCHTVAGSPKKPESQKVTRYNVMVDDMGRLESFEVEVDGVKQGGCNVM